MDDFIATVLVLQLKIEKAVIDRSGQAIGRMTVFKW